MKFSNENIFETINTKKLDTFHFVVYYLYLKNQLIYTGNIYVPANTDSVEIYLTDILCNYFSAKKITNTGVQQGLQIQEYNVQAIDEDITTNITDTIYFYNVPANISYPVDFNDNLILDRGSLLPVFPNGNNAFLAFSLKGGNKNIYLDDTLLYSYQSNYNITDSVILYNGNQFAVNQKIIVDNEVVATIGCGRYFLYWYTRNGVIQCQPFNGRVEESESINSTQITDYIGKKTNTKHKVTAKWNLNTSFINENILDLYKDIITSKYLYLYDSKTNRLHEVITNNNSFVTKTFKNYKQLFTFNVQVEENQ